uniref:scabin-related ADP-ribosyltransferase n=1 Tax=uncultured Legionella sp. TaxID=210934 RepID=UPI00260824CC
RLEKKETGRWGYEIEESDAEQSAITTPNNQKIEKSNNHAPLYFAIDASYPVTIVYRGARRGPSEIFNQGFLSQGNDTNLKLHIYGTSENRNFYKESGFVSASVSKKSALTFPRALPSKAIQQQTFLYEITPSEKGIDATKEFIRLATKSSEVRAYNDYLKYEKEIAFPNKIKAQDIKGAWPVDVFDAGIIELESIGGKPVFAAGYYRAQRTHPAAFIPNPNYKEPIIPNLNDVIYNPKGAYIWNAAKYTGHGLTGMGAILDAQSLYNEYQHSVQTHDFTNTYSEASRIAGGWSGATRLGILSAQTALIYSAPLSPIGQTAAVIVSGIVGSAAGYYFGGEATQWLYNMNRRDDLIKPVYSENIRTSTLNGTITTMESGARIGRFTYNSTPAEGNNKATEQSEAETRQKHLSNLMTTIPEPANTHPYDLYLSTLNQQTQSINQLLAASRSSIESLTNTVITKGADVDRLQNHLTGLQQSSASSAGMSQTLTTPSSSTNDLSQHVHNLASSQNTFTQAFASTRATDFSQFTQQSRPTYDFDTAEEASRYATFFSNYMHGDFRERPKPPRHNFSFFGGDNRGEGGRGWDRACDSRYQDCSSSNPGDCRSSNSDRCTSSLFK